MYFMLFLFYSMHHTGHSRVRSLEFKNYLTLSLALILSDSGAVGHIRINQLLPNKFHEHFATPLEYVVALIR